MNLPAHKFDMSLIERNQAWLENRIDMDELSPEDGFMVGVPDGSNKNVFGIDEGCCLYVAPYGSIDTGDIILASLYGCNEAELFYFYTDTKHDINGASKQLYILTNRDREPFMFDEQELQENVMLVGRVVGYLTYC